MDTNTRVTAITEQVTCDLEGDAVVLNLKNSTYYELNDVAARIWSVAQTPTTVGAIHDLILREYDVAPERAEQELHALLLELQSLGLVSVAEHATS